MYEKFQEILLFNVPFFVVIMVLILNTIICFLLSYLWHSPDLPIGKIAQDLLNLLDDPSHWSADTSFGLYLVHTTKNIRVTFYAITSDNVDIEHLFNSRELKLIRQKGLQVMGKLADLKVAKALKTLNSACEIR